jgi:biotin transporter BioY
MLSGVLARRLLARGVWGCFVAALAGLVPVYGLGVSWLAWQLHTTSFHVVVWGGVLQFLPLDVVKAFVAAAVCRALIAAPLRLPVSAARR